MQMIAYYVFWHIWAADETAKAGMSFVTIAKKSGKGNTIKVIRQKLMLAKRGILIFTVRLHVM